MDVGQYGNLLGDERHVRITAAQAYYFDAVAGDRHLRLVIDAYYASGQMSCNSSSTASTWGSVLTLLAGRILS